MFEQNLSLDKLNLDVKRIAFMQIVHIDEGKNLFDKGAGVHIIDIYRPLAYGGRTHLPITV